MSEEIKQMAIQLKEILNKYPNKQIEILSYVFGKDNLRKIINQPTYDELQQENKHLKDLQKNMDKQYERMESAINKAQEFIRNENSLNESEIDELSEILDSYRS